MMELRRFAEFATSMRARGRDRAHHEFTYNRVRPHLLILADSPPTELVLYRPGVNAGVSLTIRPAFRARPTWVNNSTRYGRSSRLAPHPANSNQASSSRTSTASYPVGSGLMSTSACPPTQSAASATTLKNQTRSYFRGIQHHSRASGRRPTLENLDKTRRLLGAAFAERCQARRISTSWTDDPTRATSPALFPALGD